MGYRLFRVNLNSEPFPAIITEPENNHRMGHGFMTTGTVDMNDFDFRLLLAGVAHRFMWKR